MSQNIICALFGHSRSWDLDLTVESRLTTEALRLVDEGITAFYTGGKGEFDALAAKVLLSIKRRIPTVRSYLIIPYLTADLERRKEEYHLFYDDIIRPEELMGIHPKQAIPLRNRWMVDQASHLIFYVTRNSGGAYAAYRYAQGLDHKRITNLASFES